MVFEGKYVLERYKRELSRVVEMCLDVDGGCTGIYTYRSSSVVHLK